MKHRSEITRSSNARCGAAILLCTLAAAVLSLASIAMLRAAQHGRSRLESLREVANTQQRVEGLAAEALAVAKADPAVPMTTRIDAVDGSGAFAVLVSDGAGGVQIDVFAYAASTQPATSKNVTVTLPTP